MELPKRSAKKAIVAINLLAASCFFLLNSCHSSQQKNPDWILGNWKTTFNGISVREHWTKKGNSYVGSTTWTKGKNRRTDWLSLQQKNDTLTYCLKISRESPIYFHCTNTQNDTLVFVNNRNNFPKRIVYVRPTGKNMHVWIDNGVEDLNRIHFPFEKITSQ